MSSSWPPPPPGPPPPPPPPPGGNAGGWNNQHHHQQQYPLQQQQQHQYSPRGGGHAVPPPPPAPPAPAAAVGVRGQSPMPPPPPPPPSYPPAPSPHNVPYNTPQRQNYSSPPPPGVAHALPKMGQVAAPPTRQMEAINLNPPPPASSSPCSPRPPPPPSPYAAQQQQQAQPRTLHYPPPTPHHPPPPSTTTSNLSKPFPPSKLSKHKINPSQLPKIPSFARPLSSPSTLYNPTSLTSDTNPPPPSDSRFLSIDHSNANPKIIRSTFACVPRTKAVLEKVTGAIAGTGHLDCKSLLLGVLITPLAVAATDVVPSDELSTNIELIPVLSSSEPEKKEVYPIRCTRCSSYLNPYSIFSTDNKTFQCNFCASTTNTLSSSSNLTEAEQMNNVTTVVNYASKYSTIEYNVGGVYDVTLPRKADVHLYAIDISSPKLLESFITLLSSLSQEILNHKEASRMGICFFAENQILFPYFKQVKKKVERYTDNNTPVVSSQEEEEDGYELALMLMSDLQDPFAPLPLDQWTFSSSNEKGRDGKLLEQMLNQIPQLLNSVLGEEWSKREEDKGNCGGVALGVLMDAMKESGGRGTLITSHRPTRGIGTLRDREVGQNSLYSRQTTEKPLYTPLQKRMPKNNKQESSHHNNNGKADLTDQKAADYYRNLGSECMKHRIRLDIVLTTDWKVTAPPSWSAGVSAMVKRREFFDVATLGELCRVCCGKLKWVKMRTDGGMGKYDLECLREELVKLALGDVGGDAIFKVRCSTGLQVKSFLPRNPLGTTIERDFSSPELELSSVTSDTCIAVELEHKVGGIKGETKHNDEDPIVYIQSALLYTTRSGHRRVRVTTLALRTSTLVPDVFRSADFGAVTAFMTRQAVDDLQQNNYSEESTIQRARSRIFNRCVNILANYRKYTSAIKSPPGQLILPESLQLLPLFCSSLRKSSILRPSLSKNTSSAHPSPLADERAYHILYGGNVSPAMALLCVHPNLYKLNGMKQEEGEWFTPSPPERSQFAPGSREVAASCRPHVCIPSTTQPSIACIDDDSIYILDDGFTLYLYVGRSVDEDIRSELLAKSEDGTVVDGAKSNLSIATETDLGRRVWNIIRQLRVCDRMGCGGNNLSVLSSRPTYAPVVLITAKKGGIGTSSSGVEEEMILPLLVDDPTMHDKGYVDFLCSLHGKIRDVASM